MMLKPEEIERNRQEFISLIKTINIPGAKIDELLQDLDNSDFYFAPASTQYHNSFEGGLCLHSLNVYRHLSALVGLYANIIPHYDQNTILIVSLLHDLSKINFYEEYTVNKKRYYEGGSKKDNLGAFDWYSETSYKVKDAKDRFLAGSHEFNSLLLIQKYIPLNVEETIAINHHHFGMSDKNPIGDLNAVANRFPLLTLLHLADMASTYLSEREIDE